jgi:hypothetical protein
VYCVIISTTVLFLLVGVQVKVPLAGYIICNVQHGLTLFVIEVNLFIGGNLDIPPVINIHIRDGIK